MYEDIREREEGERSRNRERERERGGQDIHRTYGKPSVHV